MPEGNKNETKRRTTMDTFATQLIAIQALHKKYGFTPSPQQVKLLESSDDGSYILFHVNGHEYRCENDEITNIEDQKKLDEEINFYLEIIQGYKKDLDELKDALKKMTAERDQLRGTK